MNRRAALATIACAVGFDLIGAVWFDPNQPGVIHEKFQVTLDPIAAQKAGFRMDADTVCWWMSPEQRVALDKWRGILHFPPDLALNGFSMWLDELDENDPPDPEVPEPKDGYPIKHRVLWGNGAAFDNVLLTQAYQVMNLRRPWGYSGDRCFRTMKSFPAADAMRPPGFGVQHDAQDDAEYQARWLQNILQAANLTL